MESGSSVDGIVACSRPGPDRGNPDDGRRLGDMVGRPFWIGRMSQSAGKGSPDV
jgi:hypothetical protein